MGHMADGWEGRCVLSAVPRWGQRLGATIVVTGFVVTCCMFRSVGFVFVIMLVVVVLAVVSCMVCMVTDFIDMVVAGMAVVWVVGIAMIVVMVSFVVGFNVVMFVNDVNGMVLVIVHGNNHWCVVSVGGAWKKGSG